MALPAMNNKGHYCWQQECEIRIMRDCDADADLLLAILIGHKLVVPQNKDHERLWC